MGRITESETYELLDTVNSFFDGWFLDRNDIEKLKSTEKVIDVFFDPARDTHIIGPLIPITTLLDNHALFSIVDIKNFFSGDYWYAVFPHKIRNLKSPPNTRALYENWKSFIQYPLFESFDFNTKLLDLSKLVLGESENIITPTMIYANGSDREKVKNLSDVAAICIKDFINNAIVQKAYEETNKVDINVKQLIADFASTMSAHENNSFLENLWEKAEKTWADIENRKKDWKNPEGKFANYLFWLTAQYQGIKCYLYIPGVVKLGEKHNTMGGIAIAFSEVPDRELYIIVRSVVAHVLGKWCQALHKSNAFHYALQSAVAAIMSRNGSHNIGTHVIYNVIQDIDRLKISDNKYLFKYLQQRMDFVAQISTGWVPEWTSSSWLVKELMKGFFEQRHLLNYIAKSEGLQAIPENDQKKMQKISKHIFKNKDGKKQVVIEICLGDECSSQEKLNVDTSSTKRLDEDILIAIPGGNIGFHAFYTIIENFIRNAAKHEFSTLPDRFKKQKKLRLYIEIEEDEVKKAYKIRLWDNLSYISNLMTDYEKADHNPFEQESISFNVNDNIVFKNLALEDNKIKLIAINANIISIKDVENDSLSGECNQSNGSTYYFITHPYEKDERESLRPCVIPEFSELIKKPNIRFISQPRWESFLEEFSKEDKNDKRKINKKLKGLFKDNWLPMHCKLNNKLGEKLINEDGSLRRENWGLSEMRISAGYLQKKKISEVGDGASPNKPYFIKTSAIPESNGKDVRVYRLGYEFKLLKPREILIVGIGDENLYEQAKRNRLETESVFLEKDIKKLSSFDYEFIVVVKDEVEKFLKELNGKNRHEFIERFPYRIILACKKKAKISEGDFFLSKRIAVCEEADLIDENLSVYLSKAVSEKNGDDMKMTPLEKLKIKVYEKWVGHLNSTCRGNTKPGPVHLSLSISQKDDDDKDKDKDNDFTAFFEKLNSRLPNLKPQTKLRIVDEISKFWGFYQSHRPETLPKKLYDESWDVSGKELLYSFQNGLVPLAVLEAEMHHSIISYLRHKHLCKDKFNTQRSPIYDENLRGGANHFPIVANIPRENKKPYVFKKMLLQLIENGLFKFAIADERFWDYLAKRPSLAENLAKCGVYAVKSVLSVDMGGPALENSIEIEKEDGKIKIIDKGDFAPDAIIIHQGILDKIRQKDSGYRDELQFKEFLEQLKEKIPFLAITSGRGESPDLPESAKFLGFSIIEQHIFADPHSKLLLTDSFMKNSRGGEDKSD